MPIVPMTYGIAVTSPVAIVERPWAFTMSGRKNVMPYVALTIVR